MQLEIITPEKKVFEGNVDSVILPGISGSFQILKDHAPLVSTLGKGDIVADKEKFTVDGGVVEVLKNKVLVVAESVL
jgi:F-type H+-transporting ATPase subunit epsilon